MSKDIQKIKSKIQKLLALGTSDNPNEAETAMRQAMALMQKHQICETELGADEKHTVIYSSGFTKLPPWCQSLFGGIARAMGVYMVWQNGSHGSKATVWLSGEQGACERVEYIYVTAYRQIEKMAQKFRIDHEGVTASMTNDYKRGVAISYGNRIKEVYGTMEQELADEIGTALVPMDTRIKDAEDWFKTHGIGKDWEITTSNRNDRNSAALHKGIQDGKNVQVSQGVRGNTDKTKLLN